MPPAADLARFRANLQSEVDGAALYRALAGAERDPRLAGVYARLAESEERHARFWRDRLAAAGVAPPAPRPSWRARVLAALARRFGPGFVLPTVAGHEAADSSGYRHQPESSGTALPADEASHHRVLSTVLAGVRGGVEGAWLARLEGRHRGVGGNALRAAVLGANDGLVSNLSLVMGVAGANLANRAVLLTGLAGLLAGAISMALGEWLSVTSSRELTERQIAIEAEELAEHPEEEEAELALIYEAKGLDPEMARELAAQLVRRQDRALDTLAREELGVDPEELGGSAWEAAVTSFVLFAVGAVLPVAPFALFAGSAATLVSLAASTVGLFVVGAAITLLTGRGVWFSGLRQTLFGLGAAAVTYGIGWLMGVSLGG